MSNFDAGLHVEQRESILCYDSKNIKAARFRIDEAIIVSEATQSPPVDECVHISNVLRERDSAIVALSSAKSILSVLAAQLSSVDLSNPGAYSDKTEIEKSLLLINKVLNGDAVTGRELREENKKEILENA